MKKMMKNRFVMAALLVIVFILIPTNAIKDEVTKNVSNEVMKNVSNITPTIYQTEVDQDYGFYRVIDMTVSKPAPYYKNNLTIYIGDIVTWENDATPDEPLTIISKEGLWGNRSAYLRWNYQKFTYTFNQSGIYEIYIREYPRAQHQFIIVNKFPGIDVISTPTVTLTNPIINETTIVNETIINGTINNTTNSGANKTPLVSPPRTTNIVPIETIVVIAILIILAMYFFKKR